MKTFLLCAATALTLVSTVSAADVTVYDSVVTLATNETKNYTFTDPSSGQGVTIAVTMSPYSSDPTAVFSLLDGNTRVGVGNPNINGDGNLIVLGEGVNFSATLTAASSGIQTNSIKFRVAGLGLRPPDGACHLSWNSSVGSSSILITNSLELIQGLDIASFSLSGESYVGQLLVTDSGDAQLTDVPSPGQSVMLNATFTVTNAVDVRTSSWLTAYASQYARICTNDANKAAGITAITWSNNMLSQSLPAYCGVQAIYSSSNWIYVITTGLGSHNMGPWYNDSNHLQVFPNLPVNQKLIYRFPRTPIVPASRSFVQLGEIGMTVDGVRVFDANDAFSYSTSHGTDADPVNGYTGDGVWNRDAWVNEGITFDAGYAHQQNTGRYHYHATPIALRYLLGDHVDYNASTKSYSESTNAPTKHSPIIGWLQDGFPLYGPYGYSSASNSASGVRRMVSGFVKRDGTIGSTNLNVTGRHTLPAWRAREFKTSSILATNQYAPNVSGTYPVGQYLEDYDFLGDIGVPSATNTYDLDEYNGRWCVTPEFPGGTYAYFTTINADASPAYPYNMGRLYYGTNTGSLVTSINESVTTNFLGGTNLTTHLNSPYVSNGVVTLTWTAVEGGSYQIEAATNLPAWSVLATGVSPNKTVGGYTNLSAFGQRFYRVGRAGAASYDPVPVTFTTNGDAIILLSPNSGTRGGGALAIKATFSASANPPPPPMSGAPVTNFMVGALFVSNAVYTYSNSVGAVAGSLIIPGGASTGSQTATITFSPPPGQSNGPTYMQAGAFTIN